MRISYGDVFRFDRTLNVYFYTSNIEKLLQARLLFARSGYELKHFRGDREPYEEDYSAGTEALLSRAVDQVSSEFRVRSIFFVEDTSLRLEALSQESDFPGMRVKEWFQHTSFEELDRQILMLGNDRRACVRSDIALHLPTLSRPLFFRGESFGSVAKTKPDFVSNPQYPWLTSSTFNGWFVPEGSSKRLGEMEFEESLPFDFRVKSLISLISNLEAFHAALNLPVQSYSRRRRPSISLPRLPFMTNHAPRVLCVIGYKCAGKTTLGDYLCTSDKTAVFEASTVLRGLAEEENVKIEDANEAAAFLEKRGHDCVAKRVVTYIERSTSEIVIITGFRTIEELLEVKRASDADIVLVDADARTRFERHIKRARDKDVKTFKEFLDVDETQRKFGAMRVAAEIADFVVRNESSIQSFQQRIDEMGIDLNLEMRRDTHHGESELVRSLRALSKIGRAASCEEIANKTRESARPVRRYNTNRALKEIPEFADRIERRRKVILYKITAHGKAFLELLGQVEIR